MKFRNPVDGREVEIGDNETAAHRILQQDGWTKLEDTPKGTEGQSNPPAEVPAPQSSSTPVPAPAARPTDAQVPVSKPQQTPSTVKPAEQADAKVKDSK